MTDEFTCADCGGTFLKAWSDEEAWAEADRQFGGIPPDPVVICDDCWQIAAARHGWPVTP